MEDPEWQFDTIKGPSTSRSNGAGADAGSKQSAQLTALIKPALTRIKKAHESQGTNTQLITDLLKAFELAEVSKPGITEKLVKEICTTMQGL